MNPPELSKINNLRGSDPTAGRRRGAGRGQIDVYAHRGSTVLAPENTEVAFQLALDYGADVLEIDVRLSRDGHVVVIHDERVERTCNGHGKVLDLNLKDLKKLDAAYRFRNLESRSFANQGIRLMTLPELFERFPHTRINIDIKDNTQSAAQAVTQAIDHAGCQALVNVGSFHAQALNYFRTAAPGVSTAASQREVADLYFKRGRVCSPKYRYLQIPTRYFGIPLATPAFIAHAQDRQINVVYWTINTPEAMQTLIDRGVNGLVTDRVDLACSMLRKKA